MALSHHTAINTGVLTAQPPHKFPTSKTRKRVLRERWVCDKCRQIHFDDYDEAVKHEDKCNGRTLGPDFIGEKPLHDIESSMSSTTSTGLKLAILDKDISLIASSHSREDIVERKRQHHILFRSSVTEPGGQHEKLPRCMVSISDREKVESHEKGSSALNGLPIVSELVVDEEPSAEISTKNNDITSKEDEYTIMESYPAEKNTLRRSCRSKQRQSYKENGKYNTQNLGDKIQKRACTLTKARHKRKQLITSSRAKCNVNITRHSDFQPYSKSTLSASSTSSRSIKNFKALSEEHPKEKIETKTSIKREIKSKIQGTLHLASIFRDSSSKLRSYQKEDNGCTNRIIKYSSCNETTQTEHRTTEFLVKKGQKLEQKKGLQRKRDWVKVEQREEKRRTRKRQELEEVVRLAQMLDAEEEKRQRELRSIDYKRREVNYDNVVSLLQRPFVACKKTVDNYRFTGNIVRDTTKEIGHEKINGGIDSFALMSSLKQASAIMRSNSTSFSSIPSNHISLAIYSPPKFPVPNHVFCQKNTSCLENNEMVLSDAQYTTLIRTAKYQPGLCSMSCSTAINYQGSLIDNSRGQEKGLGQENPDLLYPLFASIFKSQEFSVNNENEGNAMPSYLWTEKYALQNITGEVQGKENQETASKLVKFINEWREHRQKIIQLRAEKAKNVIGESLDGKKYKSRGTVYLDDDFWDLNSDDEDNGLCNVFLLTGPTGSGKTSLVHATAKNCQCVTLEINTTMVRGGQALKMAIEESTQSHSNLALLRKGNNAEVGRQLIEDEGEEDGPSLALVLIDEVDLLFEKSGDAGFWPAFGNLTKKAKCPIILTATDVPQVLHDSSIRFQQFSMRRPTPIECASKLCQIANMEGMLLRNKHLVENRLANIAKICNCDLRKIMNEMQLFKHAIINGEHKLHAFTAEHLTDKDTRTHCSSMVSIPYPCISNISPDIVSSDEHSVITITGNHFFGDGPNINYYKVDVYVGEQRCPAVRVINSSTILAICPPCIISKDTLRYKFAPCLTCQYAQVIVKLTLANGIELKSNSSNCRINSTGTLCTVPTVSYNFEEECNLFVRPKKCEKPKNQQTARKPNQETISLFVSSDEDDIEPISSLQKKDFTDMPNNKQLAESVTTVNYFGPTVDPCKVQSCFGEMLEKAMFKINISKEYNKISSVDFLKMSDNYYSKDKNNKDDIYDLMKRAELSSDATLLEDSLKSICVPMLSGATPGYGPDMIDDPLLLRNSNAKPPSMEKIYSAGWNDTLFFFGSSDTYVSRPYLRRDRDLFLNSFKTSRGLATFQSDSNVSTYRDDLKDKEESILFPLNEMLIQCEEDLFLPFTNSTSLFSLPSILRAVADSLCIDSYKSFHDDAIVMTIGNIFNQASNFMSLVMPFIADEKLTNNIDNGVLDYQLAMDYCPILRQMAHIELISEKKFREMKNKQTGKELRDTSTCTRRTRQSSKGRGHYFESLMCWSSCVPRDRKANVKYIGELMAKTKI